MTDRPGLQPLRPYQANAFGQTVEHWRAGIRRVLNVAPTGSGKTRLGEEAVHDALDQGQRTLWTVHRRELFRQAAERLRASAGHRAVAIIAPGHEPNDRAPIQIATVQTLLARSERPGAELVVFDEAHHYEADDWRELAQVYRAARILGLTATPERQDGRPLGDSYDRLVVVASYSQLLADGFLVPARVYQPPEILGSDLAQDPLRAYQTYAEESQAFVFCGTVDAAVELAERFCAAGIPAGTIAHNTPREDRDDLLARFSVGKLRILTNVATLTEGVDVPAARTVILARSCNHVSQYLQICGRVLRPHVDKPDAIIVDLTGATLIHGMPTEDREYSLEGRGITRTSLPPLRVCPRCGATVLAAYQQCPECQHVFAATAAERTGPKIYDMALQAVFAGANTASDFKAREYRRLRELARARDYSIGWVVKEYRKLFGTAPPLGDVSDGEKSAELARLRSIASSKGYKSGFAAARFHATFGHWPRGSRGFASMEAK